ncbi:hypothetical protein E6H13_00555 [Candidatus Bathyarchaeota archaeon]|nr:MAG: hypothetical protein E6H13_00555 [Candidatus Bathyarchaeota archaeon]
MDKKRGSFTSRDLALVAGLTGLYLVYGYASGVTFGHTILELDLFFLISALFTVGLSATLLGTVNGLILLGEPNAPVAITLALIPNGIIFDLALYTRDHEIDRLSRKRFVIAGALGNLAMAISGLVILQVIGFFQGQGLEFILATSVIALVTNPLVGAIGALFGTVVVKRVGERVRSPLIR